MPFKRWIRRDKQEKPEPESKDADDTASTFSFDLERQPSAKFYKPVEPPPPPEFIEYDSEFDSDLNEWDDDEDQEDLDHLYGPSNATNSPYSNSLASFHRPRTPEALLLRAQSARERVVERPQIARQSSLVIRREDSVVTYFNVSSTDSGRSRSLEPPLEAIRED